VRPNLRPFDLLDTSVFVHLSRGSATGLRIEADFHLTKRAERPIFSTYTEGEILGFARFKGWNEEKLTRLNDLFESFVRVESGRPEVVDAYADLYSINRRLGLNLGMNDLWIAVTARATKSRLLTCDRDFERIPDNWIDCLWIDPITGRTP
jgi:predicted nucleic acid-binding protein